MSNIVIFGATQCGKSTLTGYMATHMLRDEVFNAMVKANKKAIEKMNIGPMKKEMVYTSFASLDRDELKRCVENGMGAMTQTSIGTTKRMHRKLISMEGKEEIQKLQLSIIDTPGIRSDIKDCYMGIFESNLGIFMINLSDLENYVAPDNTEEAQRKKRLSEQRLFDPIRFWCAYKSIQSLIIVLSKIDVVKGDVKRIDNAIEVINEKLKQFKLQNDELPIIPVSITLYKDGEIYLRESHNITEESQIYPSPQKRTLLSAILEKSNSDSSIADSEVFAGVSRLCKIKNRNDYAYQVSVYQQLLQTDSRVTIGPVKEKFSSNPCFISGKIKSLKEDSAQEPTKCLGVGSIGGVILKHLYDYSRGSRQQSAKKRILTDYEILRTTAIFGNEYLAGNTITIRARDDELSIDEHIALMNLLPKETVRFIWLGKYIVAQVIELFHCENKWTLSLCPLASDYQAAMGLFAVPSDKNKNIPKLECLVIIEPKYNTAEDYPVYINFSLDTIRHFGEEKNLTYRLALDADDFDGAAIDFEININDITQEYLIRKKESDILVKNVTYQNCGPILRVIRRFLRKTPLFSFSLMLEESDEKAVAAQQYDRTV